MELGWLIWVLVAVVVIFVFLYNRLVALRQKRNNAFSDVDVQLKQRYNLVPQLVESVKAYAKHEKDVFERVTDARAQVGKSEGASEGRAKAEGLLGGALTGLLAVAENYPDLQADQNFRQLMAELTDIENKIAAARRFFNSATGEYNTAREQFPANLIAGQFGFGPESFFELDDALEEEIRKAPEVKFGS
jgi:LemA protein